jgi:hypothetical protein
MRQAAVALRSLLSRIAAGVGLEGGFLALGGLLLAVGASFLSPAGPWLVLGGLCAFIGIALAVPRSK